MDARLLVKLLLRTNLLRISLLSQNSCRLTHIQAHLCHTSQQDFIGFHTFRAALVGLQQCFFQRMLFRYLQH